MSIRIKSGENKPYLYKNGLVRIYRESPTNFGQNGSLSSYASTYVEAAARPRVEVHSEPTLIMKMLHES